MTATEELRRLLDERGVEHGDVESAPYPPYNSTRRMTTFWANKWVWQYIEDEREGGDIELEGRYMSTSVTPEQAIAATLGVTVATGERQPDVGTCHMKLRRNPYRDFLHEYTCSECGETMCKHTFFGKSEPPRWCPNCGRKVIED